MPSEILNRLTIYFLNMAKDPREIYYEKRLSCLESKVPNFDPEVMRASLSVCWLYDKLERRMNTFLTKHDLSRASFNVLAILERERCLPLNQISSLLVKTAANITGLIDGLEKRGLVRRVPHPDDRRIKLAEILPAGEQMIGELMPIHHESLKDFFSILDEAEVRTFTGLLKRLLDASEEEEE